MEPSETLSETLKQVQQVFLKMTSPEWELALEGRPAEEVAQANKELLRVQKARLQLGNAQLAEIRDKLIANEQALEQGRRQVSEALGNLQKVETALGAVSSFLGVVERIVALV